jgi:hypothetical protein
MLDARPNFLSNAAAYCIIISISFIMGLFYWKTFTIIETGMLRRGMVAIAILEMAFDAVKWHGEFILSSIISVIGCVVQFKFPGNGLLSTALIWLIITMFYLFSVAMNLLPIMHAGGRIE